MEIASVQECGCVIHELVAGIDEKMPMWDPVQRRAVFPTVAPTYATEEERRIEEASEARFPARPRVPMSPDEFYGVEVRPEGSKAKRKTKPRRKSGSEALDLSDEEAFDLENFQREMDRRKLGIGEFRGAIRAGGFKAVHLVAQGPFFLIQGEPQGKHAKTGLVVDDSTWLTLVTKRDRRNRMFLNPTAALVMLKELGVKSVQVDLESWRPDQPTDNERRRPDLAERLRFAHEYAREGKSEGLERS